MKNYIILSLLLLNILNGMELDNQEQSLKVFVIPGITNEKLKQDYVSKNTGISPEKIHRVETPMSNWSIDLGQSGCMKKLKDTLQSNKNEFILYAGSQGTGTALNFFSKNSKYAGKCKGMVLEAILGSGNSAIYHTATGPLAEETVEPHLGAFLSSKLKWVPGLYYLGPYLAKIVLFHSYSPGGDQPIKLVENLNIDGPIIIVHSEQDQVLSHEDARAIYYALTQKKDNVYFISKEGSEHVEIITPSDTFVQNILSHHNIIPKKESIDRSNIHCYQPDPEDHKAAYDELIAKEQTHTWVKRGLWSTSFVVAYVIANKWLSFQKLYTNFL